MSNVTKLRCPACLGNIAMDTPYYKELAGEAIECPHCHAMISVPQIIKPPPAPDDEHPAVTVRDLKTTQPLQPIEELIKPKSKLTTAICPHCGAEVGSRDLVCVTCEKTLR
ncbi:MAG: hypothetical protein KAH23_02555 [Kiritimatiellae bacterium]|nr:hypothetical protein [Kiritimatiellia bacterium]